LAAVSDFTTTRIKSFRVFGRKLAIVKEESGSFYATEISCKHQNIDLTTGRIEGDMATCPAHRWKYNIRTGRCLNHPMAMLRRHGLKIESGEIFVTPLPLPDAEEEDVDDMDGWEVEFKDPGR
jgi:nitrite reductase/ring-hydroxylating ferredoxin subunit